MFVYDFLHMDWPFEAVRRHLLERSLPVAEPAGNGATGETAERGADPDPPASEVPVRHLHVEVGPAHELGDGSILVPLHCGARFARGLFPVVDGDLVVAPHGEGTYFSLRGNYQPPLGTDRSAIDRFALHRLAEAHTRVLLRRAVFQLTPDGVMSADGCVS